MMAALALVWACEFWHRRTHASCHPSRVFPTARWSAPTVKESEYKFHARFEFKSVSPVARDSGPGRESDDPRALRKCTPPTRRRPQQSSVARPWEFPVRGNIASPLPESCVSTGRALRRVPSRSRRFSARNCCSPASCRAWCHGGGFGLSASTWDRGGSDTKTLWCDRPTSVAATRWFCGGQTAIILLSHI